MLYIAVTLLAFIIDTTIKQKIVKEHELGYSKEVLNGKLIIRRSQNRGAFMNFLQNRPGVLKILAGGAFVLIIIIYIFTLCHKDRTLLKTGMALMAGGALGNTFDRIKRGFVIDYFSFGILKRVVFNLSDIWIFIGALLAMMAQTGGKNV